MQKTFPDDILKMSSADYNQNCEWQFPVSIANVVDRCSKLSLISLKQNIMQKSEYFWWV